MMTDATLRILLERNLTEVNDQIDAVISEAERKGVAPMQMQNADGTFLMTDLLLAKSNCLHGLAIMVRDGRKQ